jgi:hypothetical protein
MQVPTRDDYRRAMLGCVLYAASAAAGAVDAVEAPGLSAPPDQNIQHLESIAHVPAFPFDGYAASAVQAAVDEERKESGSGYRWDGPPASSPDWWGIERDTLYFVGYQFAAIGVLYVAPEDVSGWSDEDKDDYSFDKWKDNVGNPVWDEDKWWINYVLHPYWGGTYYIRAQERGFTPAQSFLFSALLSTMYEFGVEALFEAPSYQDLIVTPVVGALVGQFLFAPLREHIRAQPGEPGWGGKTVLFLTDPMGVLNVATDRVFGVKADLTLQLAALPVPRDLRAARGEWGAGPYGNAPGSDQIPGWGLQLRATW